MMLAQCLGVVLVLRCVETSLVSVHLLHRHGARAPYYSYPNNVHQLKDWKQGAGQLTQVCQVFEKLSFSQRFKMFPK